MASLTSKMASIALRSALRSSWRSSLRSAAPRAVTARAFSATQTRRVHTSEMSDQDFTSLKVNQERLMSDLHHTCQWGTGKRWGDGPTETGMSRLALTDADKEARDWFVDAVKACGCQVTIDEMGNIFAVRPGNRDDAPPTYAGSHLDTQPSGGRYDGVLGVTAAVEMLKTLDDNWITTEYPIGVVNWTNEEGARFPISMVSSGVWAGAIPLETAFNLKEVSGGTATQRSELERIGYLGNIPCSYKAMPMAAHFELHIEQGPVLESEERKIGIVKGVQAYRWFTIEVQGKDTHTGTTPFTNRSDALLAASKMILHSHRVASRVGALASTGILAASPGSTNTVPGHVRFSLDIRASHDSTVDTVEEQLRRDFASIAAGDDVGSLNTNCTPSQPVTLSFTLDTSVPATHFQRDCISCVRAAAHGIFGADTQKLTKEMVSGAGHDSVYTSQRCPTSMIFVPSRNGISHNPEEYTSPDDCALGAQMLLGSVIRYDKLRWRRDQEEEPALYQEYWRSNIG